MASRTTVAESAVSSLSAVRAALHATRIALRTARLRRRRFSFCLIRFFAERVLAKAPLLVLRVKRVRGCSARASTPRLTVGAAGRVKEFVPS